MNINTYTRCIYENHNSPAILIIPLRNICIIGFLGYKQTLIWNLKICNKLFLNYMLSHV